jgi:general secretion pathway protein F
MAAFQYQAMDADGRTVSGILEADSARAARGQLRERGLFPLDIAATGSRRSGVGAAHRMRASELSLLTRQWGALLAAGLTVEQALSALGEQSEKESSRQVLAAVRSEILAGYSLRAALDRYATSFPMIYRASVAAGEKSGELAKVMNQLADYMERSDELRRKTVQALIYPAIVAIVAVLVVTGLLTYVVPQVVAVFQSGKQALPLLTRIMIALSGFLRGWGWLLLLAIGGGIAGLRYSLREDAVRRRWDAWLLELPLLGRHLRTLDTTRFASTLAILVGSGVPLLSALEAGRLVVVRLPLRDAIATASERVREGMSLARALAATRRFPPLLAHMIGSGEATGQLDQMLNRAARLQQGELETRTALLTSLLEPLLLLVMGGMVLLIVLAVMQPIIEINTLLK